jgi:hypothetical protein
MVAGTLPHARSTWAAANLARPGSWAFATIVRAIADKPNPSTASDADGFPPPPGLHPLFSRALSVHAINRPTSASELVEELDRLLVRS